MRLFLQCSCLVNSPTIHLMTKVKSLETMTYFCSSLPSIITVSKSSGLNLSPSLPFVSSFSLIFCPNSSVYHHHQCHDYNSLLTDLPFSVVFLLCLFFTLLPGVKHMLGHATFPCLKPFCSSLVPYTLCLQLMVL